MEVTYDKFIICTDNFRNYFWTNHKKTEGSCPLNIDKTNMDDTYILKTEWFIRSLTWKTLKNSRKAKYLFQLFFISNRFRKADTGGFATSVLKDIFSLFSYIELDHSEHIVTLELPYGIVKFYKNESISSILVNLYKILGFHPYDIRRLEYVSFPDSMIETYPNCLTGFKNIRVVKLSESLVELKSGFLSRCWNVKKITLPKSIRKVTNCFREMKSLESIELSREQMKLFGDELPSRSKKIIID